MEIIFKNTLKRHLRLRIKGTISVHIANDTLIVDINPIGCMVWRYTINNLSVQLSTGLSSIILSDVIVKQYKQYILKQYFI